MLLVGSRSHTRTFAHWLGWIAVLILASQIVQLPLHMLPPGPFRSYTVYSIVHFTLGDPPIACAIYVVAEIGAARRWPTDGPAPFPHARKGRVGRCARRNPRNPTLALRVVT